MSAFGQQYIEKLIVRFCVAVVFLSSRAHRLHLCVYVSRCGASDAHHFFAERFIGYRQSIRRRRVIATRELQHNTSLKQFFVLGALVPAMLRATRWVRPPSVTVGVGNPTTEVKEHFRLSHPLSHSFLDTVSPLMFAQLLKCCVHQRLAEQFIFGKNMVTLREGLER